MEKNVYQAPDSEVLTKETDQSEFYIVSPRKFLILLKIKTTSLGRGAGYKLRH